MIPPQKLRKEMKHDGAHTEWLSSVKPTVNLKSDRAENRFGEIHKGGSTQEMRVMSGRLTAMDEFDFLGIKTTDLYGKERNWSIMVLEAAEARARNVALARKNKELPSTAPKQPIEVPSRLMEIKLRLPDEWDYQKYTTWRKPERKLSSRRLSPARFVPPLSLPTKVGDKYLQNQKECGYFSLPGEIRNMIMGHLMGPGTVVIRSNDQPSHDYSYPTLHTSGWQFLATCQQANLEGRELYSQNDFHLAPGPLSASIDGLKDMDPRFQGLVKNVTTHLSILDLTPAVLDRIEKTFFPESYKMITSANYHQMSYYVRNALLDLWLEKIRCMRDAQTIDRFKLVCMHFIESDGADDHHTQWPTHILTVHLHDNIDSIDGLYPSISRSEWSRASRVDDLHLSPRGKDIPNSKTRMMLFITLVHIEKVIATRLRDGMSASDGRLDRSWTAFKLWLKNLQVTTKEYTWEGGPFFDRHGFRVRRMDWK